MNRKELDAFVAHHRLAPVAIEASLDIAAARPSANEIRHFAIRLLQLAGVLSLAAGVVFFIAANWSEFGVAGRFALVQSVLVVSVALALWRPPSQSLGKYAVLMAFISTGALLALFGQTYQTGADIYELFLTWAVLGLPFVIAARWSVVGGAWLVVVNISLLLFFGWQPQGGWLWTVFSPWNASTPVQLLVPTILNLAAWMLAEYLHRVRRHSLAPRWIARLALTCAMSFATWAATHSVIESSFGADAFFAVSVILVLEAVVAVYAMSRRDDVFPLALIAGSLITISTCAFAANSGIEEVSLFFLIALWLVATSTISGRLLMSFVRAWYVEEEVA
jgi:uncharacterized membrane protein